MLDRLKYGAGVGKLKLDVLANGAAVGKPALDGLKRETEDAAELAFGAPTNLVFADGTNAELSGKAYVVSVIVMTSVSVEVASAGVMALLRVLDGTVTMEVTVTTV